MLVDEVDIQYGMLEGDEDRDIKVREEIKKVPHFENITKRWESASKMRQWISEKKKNLIERIKKDVETEYKKKKEEKPAAAEPEKPKEEKPAEEAPKPEEEKSSIELEEITMIDTTSKPAEGTPSEEVKKEEEAPKDSSGLTEADKTAID